MGLGMQCYVVRGSEGEGLGMQCCGTWVRGGGARGAVLCGREEGLRMLVPCIRGEGLGI